MNRHIKQNLIGLFEHWSREKARSITPLPPSGSYREYYRIMAENITALGTFNPDRKENIAFTDFSKHFRHKGLPVPMIYAEELEHDMYLVQDLGDTTLFSYLTDVRQNGRFPDDLLEMYKTVLEELPRFQILAGEDLNYKVCYPRARFDKQSMLWDLNYFKYYFLKLAKVHFDEQDLEDDFQTFTDYLLQTDCHFFLYRDFQSRNIMLYHGKPYFIDYQGGRRGALQYDVASLLYDAKADIPQHIRVELLDHYIGAVSKFILIDEEKFRKYYYGYVLIRMMQAMGSYGFRGFYEKKEHFLQSIPYAIKNLEWILETVRLPIKIPQLTNVLNQLVDSETLKNIENPRNTLTVRINSFSYKRGIPIDESGNGGGYVFDCRVLQNPGRYEQYKHLTGKDEAVIEFFERDTEVEEYLKSIYALLDRSVENYQQRNFASLMVNFGCTGGQHRSVYCAERLAKHLEEKDDVKILLRHIEQEMK
jgi:aminoglycoside/choline kinase family phosphotransferase